MFLAPEDFIEATAVNCFLNATYDLSLIDIYVSNVFSKAAVGRYDTQSDRFFLDNGVKQGLVLGPILFSAYLYKLVVRPQASIACYHTDN